MAWENEVDLDGRTVRVNGVSFSASQCVFRVLDNPPAARISLPAALSATGAFAGVNGGYFHEDFTPLGLVVSKGRTLHSFERAKLLSGIVAVRDGRMALVRAPAFAAGSDVQEALQAGPWLLEKGHPINGLNEERLARRTIVARAGDHWAVLTTSPVTLAGAARLLAMKNLAGPWTISDALNLDGGSSTALFATAGSRPLLDIPSLGPVRNYLAIVPRQG